MPRVHLYISFFLSLLSPHLHAQSLQLVAVSGHSVANEEYAFDYSIGEVAINTISSYTIGFLQPIFAISVEPPIPAKDNAIVVYEFFSPNSDGKNDTFYVKGLEEGIENEVMVFDRTGKVVFHRKNYTNNWEGEGLPEDNYFYVVKVPPIHVELRGGLVLTR